MLLAEKPLGKINLKLLNFYKKNNLPMKIIFIAEAGINHNGSIKNAIKLVDIASDSGADYVKFQRDKFEFNIEKNSKS